MDKKTENALREKWAMWLTEKLQSAEEEALRTSAGSIYVPTVDSNGDDAWIELRAVVHPSASEENGTDGYSLATQYAETQKSKAEKKAKKSESKSKKGDK